MWCHLRIRLLSALMLSLLRGVVGENAQSSGCPFPLVCRPIRLDFDDSFLPSCMVAKAVPGPILGIGNEAASDRGALIPVDWKVVDTGPRLARPLVIK